ncbi:MAG: HisA/HisF-related TIM barrel protein [Candidatus Omnitrophica bacterium]|nr:HisA/HisF-related TIM barrel protein [Candidatus Omnitrophota bacterium]MDD5488833.1 HisA/HisF-related TIM barrel protein [Candidatus Omnitrophota bacterium]
MLKKRLIPVLLLQNGLLVRSELFKIHQIIGNPVHEVERFNQWNVDELVYLDITRGDKYDLRREDHKIKGLATPEAILDAVSRNCFMPLTWGGRIRSVEDMRRCINHGADKISINTSAVRTPELITAGAKAFGSQAIVVSIDVRAEGGSAREVFIDGGRESTGLDPVEWAIEAEKRGAGEILLQVIGRDGTGSGYDTGLIRDMSSAVRIPLVACSGVAMFEDYADGIKAGASAVAAANIWHFKELTDRAGKRAMARAGIDVRL